MFGFLIIFQLFDVSNATDIPAFKTVKVPAGTVMMGCMSGDELCVPFENPRHEVHITHALEVMTTEVTQGLYFAVKGTNPSRFTDCGAECPVEYVNWDDAISFANKLSEKQGLKPCYTFDKGDIAWNIQNCTGWRLPTEAEWEYLARGGKETLYSGGSTMEKLGWIKTNSQDQTHPVAQLKPNAYGLYDMSGNVFEWVWDWYATYSDVVENPIGPKGGADRVCRGGGWNLGAKFARASRRMHDDPSMKSGFVGFRLVRKY